MRNTLTSVDPGLRLRLRESGPAGYFTAFALDAPMDGIMGVGEVIESRAEGFCAGDTVWHAKGWRDYAVVTAGEPALGGLGTLTRLDVRWPRAAALPRPARRHGRDGLRRADRGGGAARGRRRLGVGGGGRGRQPRRADRQAPRPPRRSAAPGSDEKVASCSTSSASTRPSTTGRAPSPTCCARPRPTGSTSTSTTSAATTSRRRSAALRRRGRVGAVRRDLANTSATEPARGPAQPVPGDGQRPDAARLPRQRYLHRMADDAARARRLARRRAAALPRDGRRRPRARARGARRGCWPATRSARRSCGSPDRQTGPDAARARFRAGDRLARRRGPRRSRAIALRGTSASPITRTPRRRGTSALQSRATRSPTTTTRVGGHASRRRPT